MNNTKLILLISFISVAFYVLIGFDVSSYLRGPAPYPPDWQWSYLFINTLSRIWFPLIIIFLIFILFLFFDNKKQAFIQKNEKRIIFLLIFISFIFQFSVLFFGRSGINVLIHRIINPDLNGYFTASLNIDDIFNFLKNYNDNVLSLPMHAKGHPPGAVLFFYFLNSFFKFFTFLFPLVEELSPSHTDVFVVWKSLASYEKLTAIISSLIIPFLASLTIYPLYFLAKKLYDTKIALRSIFLYIFIPGVVLFTPINDVFLSIFPLTSLLFLIKGLREEDKYFLIISGLIFFLGIFFSLSLLPLGLVFLVLFISEKFIRSCSRLLSIVPKGLFFILGFLLTPILLFIFFDFNFLEVTQTLMSGLPPFREYYVWIFYNLYDFFVFVGIPVLIVFVLMLKKIVQDMVQNDKRKKTSAKVDFLFLGFVLMLFILNFSGAVRGEVGRIWIPFMPFLILPTTFYLTKVNKLLTKHFLIILFLQALEILILQEFWVMLW